jgi:HK97 gp10 family phage protein
MADDLDEYLNNLPDKLAEQLSALLREQAERLSEAQKETLRSLEQSPEETGTLEASCVVVPGASDLEFLVQAGGDATTKEVREGSGVNYDYALGFEFGTSHQPARPFFYSTYEAMKDQMQDAIDDAVNEVIDK